MTCDMWHVTCDMWHMTCLGGWTFSQNFSSLALTVCDLKYYEDLEEKAHSVNQLINELDGVGHMHCAVPSSTFYYLLLPSYTF